MVIVTWHCLFICLSENIRSTAVHRLFAQHLELGVASGNNYLYFRLLLKPYAIAKCLRYPMMEIRYETYI